MNRLIINADTRNGTSLTVINADNINSAWVQDIGGYYVLGVDAGGHTYYSRLCSIAVKHGADKANTLLTRLTASMDGNGYTLYLEDFIEDIID